MSLASGHKLSRIARVSWDELHTRVRQELSKRLDAGLYSVGLQPGRVPLNPLASQGRFFFSPADLAERVGIMREHLPDEVSAIVAEADEICRHHFHLLGYTGLDYAAEIDWHLDVVHSKRAPHKPWFRIDFLNFAEVGDHKVTWELNRHQHLVTLAKAWVLTGEERYADEIVSQWYAWHGANPYPIGINWASSLEIALRSLAWIWIRHFLAGCPVMTDGFSTDLLQGLALNGRHIERYLSTYFSPNTHLLGEAVALFFIGVLCPQIPAASRWREKGLRILLQEAGRQVYPDGVYFEQSLYYHVYALDLFLHTRLLAERNEIEVSLSFDQVIQRMLKVLEVLSQNGPPHGFGDDDGGRVFNPRRNRGQHMTDPLVIGALLFSTPPLRTMARLTEEAVWLFGAKAALLPQQSGSEMHPRSQCFRDAGIYISFTPGDCREQLIIDAGPQGALRCGHGHADALSVTLSFDLRPWLTDSGTFSYMSDGAERDSFRGTTAHNTLRVDGLDQAVAEGPFAWSEVPSVRAESWITGDTFTFFRGHHTGYRRLADPVVHRRLVVHIYNVLCMVCDIAEGSAPHELEISWHLAPNIALNRAGGGFAAFSQDRQGPCERLALVPVNTPDWNCDVRSGQVSPAYGTLTPAQVLRCKANLRLPATHAMVFRSLVPEQEDDVGELVCIRSQSQTAVASPAIYEYRENRRSHFMIFADSEGKTWEFGDLSSDAGFLYYRSEAQCISQFIACQATFIRHRGEPLFSLLRRVERFECWEKDGRRQVSSSDPEALTLLRDNALESKNAGVVG